MMTAQDARTPRFNFLLEKGFRIFPVQPNSKEPTLKGWQTHATNDPDSVESLFDNYPLANVGIATGDGLLVVDVDTKRGKSGLASLDAVQSEHGPLPDTLKARTPTGGIHLYFRYDHHAFELGNRANIRDGLDARGRGGYVLAPPSTISGAPYHWTNNTPIADAPPWLIALVGRRELKQSQPQSLITHADTAPNVLTALRFLQNHPPAVEGAGGDHHTFVTASKLKDFGISADLALELMFTVWNPTCSPPWDHDELAVKVENAFKYSENPLGSHTPEAVLPEDETTRRAREQTRIKAETRAKEAFAALRPSPILELNPQALPSRKWIIPKIALEQRLTVLISPGGVGKSTFTINAALAVATGRKDILDIPIQRPAGAWIFNNEDDQDELLRRTYAAMRLHNISPQDLNRRLFLNSGQNRPLTVARRVKAGDASIITPADADAFTGHLIANDIKLAVIDPFIETHDADENDNGQIAAVARIYRQIAQYAQCAVILVHHTRKHPSASPDTAVGDADSGRGAGALMNVARVGLTLYGMSAEAAKRLRVPENERWRYVRLDDAKQNLSVKKEGVEYAQWFEKVGVDLETSEDGVSEQVGALRPWARKEFLGDVDSDERFTLAVREALKSCGGLSHLRQLGEGVRLDPLYSRETPDSIRKRIERRFAEPFYFNDGFAIEIVRDGKAKDRRALSLQLWDSGLGQD